MLKTRIAKIAAVAVGMTFVLGLSVNTAGAVTAAELQAQINALMAQLSSLQGGASTTFTMDLTVGSTGAQVTALQQVLVSNGYLVMPQGVAYGYFGALTKAAVTKWQAAVGLPATGFFGPMSRAKLNGSAGATGTVPGSTVGSGSTSGGISTPGVEGVLTARLAPTPGSGTTVREGDSKEPVLGLELEADLSDIKIERIKVKLDSTQNNDRDFYRDVTDMMYIMDGSTVLASVELDSDSVVEESDGSYYVTITGLNYIVRKNAERTLTVAIDASDSFDSDITGDDWTVTIPVDGVRGVDGAGVNQYAPESALARTFETQPSSSEDASLTISLNTNSPKAQDVIASSGSDEDERDMVELLRADFRAEDDDIVITDVTATITHSGSATTSTAYLYDGSTLVASASVNGSSAVFDDIEVEVDEDSTKTLTLKVDIRDAVNAATTLSASIAASGVTAENTEGDDADDSGSATGETMTVRKVGIEVSLVSKSITKSSTSSQNNTSTSTVEANFVLRVKAVGADVILGTTSSTTPFASNAGNAVDDDPTFKIYVGGSATSLAVASSTAITIPSGVANETNNSFTIQENNTVDIPVSFTFVGRAADGSLVALGSYAVQLAQLNWVTSATGPAASSFMDGRSEWRTSTVSLP